MDNANLLTKKSVVCLHVAMYVCMKYLMVIDMLILLAYVYVHTYVQAFKLYYCIPKAMEYLRMYIISYAYILK